MKKFVVLCTLVTTSLLQAPAQGADPPDLDKLRQKPITTAPGKVGELLRQWWKEGTAAGNAGDFYDNRDKDHSPLNLAPYPQLSAIKYTAEDEKFMRHWAAQRVLLPHVTFGNSSTSAPPTQGGSNPRMYYTSPQGVKFLYEQYTRNNLYLYPEHRDHDPGHNDKGNGFGDLYPTNTPYLMISQGSSGSDQPFMRMLPFVLASFRPDVKKKLTETGTLMPTIQMLWRSTNKQLKDPKEYLTGKAHPAVFEGTWVDELALVQKAHALELKALPPMVQLKAIDEDKAERGIDYFDRPESMFAAATAQTLADTPCCIARIHRTRAQKYRIVVSAEASFDVNKSPLTYTWVVLRGDPAQITITPKKDDKSVVEIAVAYHDRRPVSPGAALESNRVDIGVFVHNGTWYSAPGFVTFYTLDNEARTYSPTGAILDIAYGMGESDMRVKDWDKILTHVATDALAGRLLRIDAPERDHLKTLQAEYQRRGRDLKLAQLDVKVAEMEAKDAKETADKEKTKKLLDAARQRVTKAQKDVSDFLDGKDKVIADSPRHYLESRLVTVAEDPLFTQTHRDWLKERRTPAHDARIKSLWQRLVRYGIATQAEVLTPLLPGKTLEEAKWTKFERAQLEVFHAGLLADLVFPGMLQVDFQVNFVDQRLAVPRDWRDVYRYDPKGEFIGWMRYSGDGVQFFNHEGLLVVEQDKLWRCVKGRTVRYAQEVSKGKGFNMTPLRAIPGETLVRYEFDGDRDYRGHRAGTESAPVEKKK